MRATRAAWVANLMLPGIYAWLSTVFTPALGNGGWVAEATAALAAASLAVGILFFARRPRLGRLLGIYGFVGFAVITWVILGRDLQLSLEPLRAALGGVGWLLYALGWGSLRQRGNIPEKDPRAIQGTPLEPRARLPWGVWLVLGSTIVGCVSLMGLAWRIDRPAPALLGHAAAIAASVWLLSVTARVTTSLDERKVLPSARRRLALASSSLSALVLVLAFGVVWLLLS